MKKLLALLLSVAMVASMFVGVAFASSGTAVLNVTVTGTIALNSTIQVGGSVLNIVHMPATIYNVVVQRQAPGETTWSVTHILYGSIGNTTSLPPVTTIPITSVQLNQPGTYRVALTGLISGTLPTAATATGGALNAAGGAPTAAAPALVHTIGTVAPHALAVTTTTPNVQWGIQTPASQVYIPLTVTRSISGVLHHFYDTATIARVTYNGVAIDTTLYAALETLTASDIAARVVRVAITRPPTTLATGPLVITLAAESGHSMGSVTVNVVARDTFNILVTPSATPTVGVTIGITVQAFDGLGNLPDAVSPPIADRLYYTVSTITGPFATPSPASTLRVAGAGAISWTGITPRQGGDIVITTMFYSGTHVLLATVSRTIPVAGLRLERPVPSVRLLDERALRVIVTDAAGNRINNARVRFIGAANQFAIRDPNTGVLVNTAASTLEVTGMLATQPLGFSVVNGEYSVDVRVRARGDIRVEVALPTLVGTQLDWSDPQINWPGAITVGATLGYTLTLNHTLLAGPVDETVLVTVLDTAGAFVNSGLHFTAAPVTAGAGVITIPSALPTGSGGVWTLVMRADTATSYTITANNNAVAADATLTGTATITAVAPLVAVTPGSGLITQNMYDVLTVRVTDPRTSVAVYRTVTVAVRTALTPFRAVTVFPAFGAPVPTAINFEAQNRALTTTGTDWDEADGEAVNVSERQFRVLTGPQTLALRTIAGVVNAPQVSVTVPGAAAIHLTLAPATLQVTPAQLLFNRNNDVTIRLLNAHGEGMARTVSISGAITLASTTLPAAGLTLRVRPEPGVVFAPEATFTVPPVLGAALTAIVPVAVPPADTVAPVITTNAPTTTTAAAVAVTITATDDVAVRNLFVDGVNVAVLSAPSVSAVRTLTLAVGVNTFIVQADDAAGNATTHTITIERTAPPAPPADTVAPVITHNAPATTALESVPVTITATDAVAVTRVIVGGVEVPVIPAASVSVVRTLPLAVGANPFVVQAADAAGNIGTVTITITRTAPVVERVLPTIEVTAPSITTEATAMITIVARDNVAVTGMIFEGVSMSFFPAATVTVFRTVDLREGLNSFALSVTDAAGNAAHRVIVIDRRTPAPVVHTITLDRANPAIGLDVPATVRNGRLFVPFRWFAERILGATVEFRVVGAAEIVTLHRGNMHVELTLNSPIAKVNGVPVDLGRDMVPYATGGRTLVPARFLAETFGYVVNWNPVTNDVTFTLQPTRP